MRFPACLLGLMLLSGLCHGQDPVHTLARPRISEETAIDLAEKYVGISSLPAGHGSNAVAVTAEYKFESEPSLPFMAFTNRAAWWVVFSSVEIARGEHRLRNIYSVAAMIDGQDGRLLLLRTPRLAQGGLVSLVPASVGSKRLADDKITLRSTAALPHFPLVPLLYANVAMGDLFAKWENARELVAFYGLLTASNRVDMGIADKPYWILFVAGVNYSVVDLPADAMDALILMEDKTGQIDTLEECGGWEQSNGAASATNPDRPLLLGNGFPLSRSFGLTAYEQPVMKALRWLAAAQKQDGSWDDGTDSAVYETSLALLAFVQRGLTANVFDLSNTVSRAAQYLVTLQEEDGSFAAVGTTPPEASAAADYALCWAYRLTGHPELKAAAEKGLRQIVRTQLDSGLWPSRVPMDPSASFIWQVQALSSAKPATLESGWSDEQREKAVTAIKAAIHTNDTHTTCAAEVLALQLLGHWRDPEYAPAVLSLRDAGKDWDASDLTNPIREWFFVTYASFQQGGRMWGDWQKSFVKPAIKRQIIGETPTGEDTGYWSPPPGDPHGPVYTTVHIALMLQWNYRMEP